MELWRGSRTWRRRWTSPSTLSVGYNMRGQSRHLHQGCWLNCSLSNSHDLAAAETTTRAIRADLSAAVSGDMDIVKTEAAELRLTAKEAIASGARILRFEAVLERLSDVPARFTGIENRISNVEASLGRLSQVRSSCSPRIRPDLQMQACLSTE